MPNEHRLIDPREPYRSDTVEPRHATIQLTDRSQSWTLVRPFADNPMKRRGCRLHTALTLTAFSNWITKLSKLTIAVD